MQPAIDTIKNIWSDIDLYGWPVLLAELQNKFKAVAYTNKSIPSQGSPCRSSKDIADNLSVQKLVFHRNGEITAFTNHGNLRFF